MGETRGELAAVEHGDTEGLGVVIAETGVNIWESNIQRPRSLIKFFSPYNIGDGPYNIGDGPYNIGDGPYNIGDGPYIVGAKNLTGFRSIV